jgi:hypothetical protein
MKTYNRHVEWKAATGNPFTALLFVIALCALILLSSV